MNNKGRTFVELVIVLIVIGIILAIGFPSFRDARVDAKNGAVQAGLQGLRSAINIATATIAAKEVATTPRYPTALELQTNVFTSSHPRLSGQLILTSGVPKNPWTISTYTPALTVFNTIWNCLSYTKSQVRYGSGQPDRGWCYNQTNGEIWANSSRNSGAAGKTENYY